MKPALVSFSLLFALTPLFSLQAEESIDRLLEEIQRTVDERDTARKELLKKDVESREAIESLRREREALSENLEQRSREILRLEATLRQSTQAVERAKADLAAKNQAVETMEAEQAWMQQKYQQVLKNLETLSSSTAAGEMNILRSQQQQLERQLQKSREELNRLRNGQGTVAAEETALQEMNAQLQGELQDAKRSENLSQAKLDAMAARLDTLRNELALQYEERSQLEQAKEKLTSSVADLQAELEDATENRVPRSELEALQGRLAEAQQANQSLEQQLSETRAIPDLRQDFAAVTEERNQILEQNEKLSRQLRNTESTLEKATQSSQALADQLQASLEKAEQLTAQQRSLEETIERLERELAAATENRIDPAEKQALEDQLQLARSEIEALQRQLAEAKAVPDLRQDFEAVKRERNLLSAQRKTLEAQLAAAEERLQQARRNQGDIDAALQERNEALEGLEQEKEALETQLADLQNELDDAMRDRVPRAEWLQMQNQLQATQAEVARLQQALDAAEARPDLKPDLDKVKRERDLLSAQNKTLNAKLAESETSLENSRATQLELQQERDNLAASLAAEQEQRQQLEQDIASLQAGLAEAEAAGITPEALTSVQQLLETMQQENEELKTKVAEQQTTVDTLMQERSEDEKVRDRKVRELQGMLGQQLEALAEANQQIAQLERSQSELEKVRMERTRLEQRQQKNRKDMQTLASHIYELREKVAAGEKVEMELAREVNRSNQLTASLQEVKQELSSLQRLQEVLGEEKARRDDQLRELRQQLRLREEREKSLQEEKEALQKELERLNTSSRDN